MELKNYLRVLRQNIVLVIAAALVGALGGLAVALLAPTTYASQTELFVSIPNAGSAADLQQGSAFTQERLQTYVKMTEGRSVLQPVIDELGLEDTTHDLAGRIKAKSDPDTVLISIEVTDRDPAEAARIAEAVAASLVDVITELENPQSEGTSPVRLSVANPAAVPTRPSSLGLGLETALGALVGIVLGIGVALVRSAFDSRLRGKEDLRRITQAPVLSAIPADPATTRTPLITDLPAHSPRAEAFRRLRTNLRFVQVDDPVNSVLVASAVAGEGKTTTSINLALVMAQAGKRIALVDADLRRPRVAEKLGLENSAGLTTALVGAADVFDLLQPWGQDELYVLTAGEIPPNPAELLDSHAMQRLLGALSADFDLVIIDGPPMLPVADGLILAQQVGRVLLVAAAGQVHIGEVQETLNSLQMVDVSRVGIVLNKVSTSSGASGYYGTYVDSPSEVESDGGDQAGRPQAPSGDGSGQAGLPQEPAEEHRSSDEWEAPVERWAAARRERTDRLREDSPVDDDHRGFLGAQQ